MAREAGISSCWVLGAGCWVLGAGCWVLGANDELGWSRCGCDAPAAARR
ncbi:MAG TPA: hypothetical protein VFJ16_11755 [Longimicrobium sp.]|nr:hypothetical protein [Longimicrobium sp.]